MWVVSLAITLALALPGSASPSATSSPSGSDAPSAIPLVCQEALEAQDEVIGLMEKKIAELELALVERKMQIISMEYTEKAVTAQVEALARLLSLEVEAGARERRRAVWAERWKAVQYGALGFAGGVLVERVAE